MQIDNKFIPRVCKRLIRKLNTGNKKHKYTEVQLLVLTLLREIMQTPLTEFESQSPDKRRKSETESTPMKKKDKLSDKERTSQRVSEKSRPEHDLFSIDNSRDFNQQ